MNALTFCFVSLGILMTAALAVAVWNEFIRRE